MKRKLDEQNVPSVLEHTDESAVLPPVDTSSFVGLGLDPRILKGILKQEYSAPTQVQQKAIPLALQGKDVLARAKTGSGKTAAYLLPILHSLLRRKSDRTYTKCVSALILVPTRELAEQVYRAIESLSTFCAKDIRAVNLSRKVSEAVLRTLLSDSPDIVVTTPSRASSTINSSALQLGRLSNLVIDEADLVLSYGYDEDLQTVSKSIPKGVQTMLMSATLSSEVDTVKGLFCRDPVVLQLEEKESKDQEVSQFVIRCGEEEKFLLLFVILKLRLIKGKFIIFVGDIDRCYRLKLYLEQFGIRSCVLNSELPVNSRIHVVEEFNKNVYDIIIATDEHEIVGDEEDGDVNGDTGNVVEGGADGVPTQPPKKRSKGPKKDKEYGISRGIDFQNVACVLNFDLPSTSKSYTHRIGRTARAGKAGMALSLAVPRDQYRKHKPTSIPSTKEDETVLAKINRTQQKRGHELKPYAFDMKQVEPFRYRIEDALKAVTRSTIREARTRELRAELLKSDKLKRHFEENPDDLQHLRHDGESRTAKVQAHLKHVPDYLLPKNKEKGIMQQAEVGFVGFGRTSENRIRKARAHNRAKARRGGGGGSGGRKADPLKSFRGKRTK
ncbi:MAG: ATP-dependent DNA/RNA helicase [Chaenotheca gracillima]|nr:MAG: ATP-dependent DNA/RNA helicase [Chaenotheca gracillima]